MEREKNREKIKELIIRQEELFAKKKSLDPYERGVLDTLVKLYDEEFCYGRDSVSIYELIHDELGVDLYKQRQGKVDNIRQKVDKKIEETLKLWPELTDIIINIKTEAHKAIDKIDITKNRPELWNDMQDLKDKLNSMISLLTNRIDKERS